MKSELNFSVGGQKVTLPIMKVENIINFSEAVDSEVVWAVCTDGTMGCREVHDEHSARASMDVLDCRECNDVAAIFHTHHHGSPPSDFYLERLPQFSGADISFMYSYRVPLCIAEMIKTDGQINNTVVCATMREDTPESDELRSRFNGFLSDEELSDIREFAFNMDRTKLLDIERVEWNPETGKIIDTRPAMEDYQSL